MPEVLVRRAPAKTNLVLEVTARRTDGYHEVDTVLQELELADEVRVTARVEDKGGLDGYRPLAPRP